MARAQVADYLADEKTVTIGDENDPLIFKYRPSRMTPEFATRYSEVMDGGKDLHRTWVFVIGSLIVEWNMKGPVVVETVKLDRLRKPIIDDYGVATYERTEIVPAGAIVPIDSKVLSKMKTTTLSEICRALFEDARADMTVDPQTGSESN